jgi:tRNA G18 (ribose-2'-O)-methylase SpoU
MERVPYQATETATAYQAITRVPVAMLLDDIRSLYNVGSFFRTADSAGIERLYLCGITGHPPDKQIAKVALGADQTVDWEHSWDAAGVAETLRGRGYELAAIETSLHSVDLFDWQPRFPVCVLFGHEVDGVRKSLLERCDVHVRIPMLGRKHSLNVATAAGVVAFELLRKYRRMLENR